MPGIYTLSVSKNLVVCATSNIYVKLHSLLQDRKVFCLCFGKYGVPHSLTELYTEGVIIQ